MLSNYNYSTVEHLDLTIHCVILYQLLLNCAYLFSSVKHFTNHLLGIKNPAIAWIWGFIMCWAFFYSSIGFLKYQVLLNYDIFIICWILSFSFVEYLLSNCCFLLLVFEHCWAFSYYLLGFICIYIELLFTHLLGSRSNCCIIWLNDGFYLF